MGRNFQNRADRGEIKLELLFLKKILPNKSIKKGIPYALIFCLLIITGCSSLFFYPQKELIDNSLLQQVSYEDVYFTTPDGLKLHGWLIRGGNGNSNGIILQLHGNAENISTHVNNVIWLAFKGYDIFVFDYRGYGRSEGQPTIDGVHIDAKGALETIINLPDISKKRIFVFGQSLGGAIAVYTVATSPYKDRINAVIIDSAFSSYRGIAREKLAQFILTWPFQYPLSLLFNDYYSPVKWIKQVYPIPILIIHGSKDIIVPVKHGKILYEEALTPKGIWVTEIEGHIRSLTEKDLQEKLAKYLQEVN